MDRQWIFSRNRLTTDYREGVQSFIDVAGEHVDEKNEILCPCMNCHNKFFRSIDDVHIHLLDCGMDMSYDIRIYHGENIHEVQGQISRSISDEATNDPNVNMFSMIEDAFQRLDEDDQVTWGDQDTTGDQTNGDGVNVDNYEKLLCEAKRELYPGCTEYTILTYVVELIHNKVESHMTEKAIDRM